MEKVWNDQGPHERFLRQLMNSRVDELVNSQNWLKQLRYRHEEVHWWNKRAGYIFEERGINLYQLIAQAYGSVGTTRTRRRARAPKPRGFPRRGQVVWKKLILPR